MKIFHIINSLGNGGAEKNLIRLILNDNKNIHHVIALKKNNFHNKILRKNKIKIFQFDISLNKNFFNDLKKINRIIFKNKPTILMCWMYHSILIGTLINLIQRKTKLIWNIRHSNFSLRNTKLTTIILARFIISFLHLIPKAIIYNSSYSLKVHNSFFIFNKKQLVIRNGFNLPSRIINKKQKMSDKITKIGFVGRYSPQKNHHFFFKFLSKLNKDKICFKTYLVGNNVNKNNRNLKELVNRYNLHKNVVFLKEKKNIDNYYQRFDLVISTSFYGESFPNILAESMMNKTICIAPNIGENLFIINDKKLIYKKNDLSDLYIKYTNILKYKDKKQWFLLQNKLHNRVKNELTIKKMLYSYNNLFSSI